MCLEAQLAHTPALLLKLAAVIQQEKCVNNATRRSTLCSCASVARLCVGASGFCLSKRRRSHSVCSLFLGGVDVVSPDLYLWIRQWNKCDLSLRVHNSINILSSTIIAPHPASLSSLTGRWAWPGPHCGPYGKPQGTFTKGDLQATCKEWKKWV